MLAAIAEPSKELSPFAPRIETIQVESEDIRLVIGKGGDDPENHEANSESRSTSKTAASSFATSVNGEAMIKAKERIKGIVEA